MCIVEGSSKARQDYSEIYNSSGLFKPEPHDKELKTNTITTVGLIFNSQKQKTMLGDYYSRPSKTSKDSSMKFQDIANILFVTVIKTRKKDKKNYAKKKYRSSEEFIGEGVRRDCGG